MPREAMITPLTLYNLDNTIFDGITLPDYHFPRSIEYDDLFLREGWTLSKEVLINNILLETAELDTIYTNPEFFKFAVTQWAAKEYPVWRALYETLFYKYNPIWNKDGTVKRSEREIRDLLVSNTRTKTNTNVNVNNEQENIHDDEDITDTIDITDTDDITDTTSHSGAKNNIKDANSNKTLDGTVINSVSAFDSMNSFANRDKAKTDNTENIIDREVNIENESIGEEVVRDRDYVRDQDNTRDRTNDRNRNLIGNNIQNGSEQEVMDTTDGGNVDKELEEKDFGNIGLTTTQSLIQAERDLVKFNIYDLIVDSFKARFCLLLY